MTNHKGRVVAALAALGVAAIFLTGCINVVKVDGAYYSATINASKSAPIVFDWAGPTCNQDVDRDGSSGTPHDRALCAFFIIRAQECSIASSDNAKGECNLATTANGRTFDGTPLWFEFTVAAQRVAQFGGCLQVRFYATGDIRDWSREPVGVEGCLR